MTDHRSPVIALEREPEPDAPLTLRVVPVDTRDLAVSTRSDAALRVSVDRVIEHVASLQPQLQPARSAQGEHAEHREVQVVAARPVELVAAGVAKPHAGRLR